MTTCEEGFSGRFIATIVLRIKQRLVVQLSGERLPGPREALVLTPAPQNKQERDKANFRSTMYPEQDTDT